MTNEKTATLLKDLHEGVANMIQSGQYIDILKMMSGFHQYSFNNMMLIWIQRPNAGRVAGFKAWQTKFGRHVKKGAKAIWILAPNTSKGKKKVINEKGEETEEEYTYISSFRSVPVFSEHDTEGKPIPDVEDVVEYNTDDIEGYEKMLRSLEKATKSAVTYEEITDGSKGYYCRTTDTITIKNDMSQAETVSVLSHEIAHSILHREGMPECEESREVKELEAESVAYIVCRRLGFDTGKSSFGYVATWASENTMETLCKKMELIGKTADQIIAAMA